MSLLWGKWWQRLIIQLTDDNNKDNIRPRVAFRSAIRFDGRIRAVLRVWRKILPDFRGFDAERRFMEAWNSIRIARPVHYSLFTFGESDLPYFLVLDAGKSGQPVSIRQGMVKIARPLIITPDNAAPELQNFFENEEESGFAQFLLSRQASFSHLRLNNMPGGERIVSDSVEEAVDRLNRQLDDEEEDRVAILTAPLPLAGIAILRYASERVMQSATDNITELRERGFLP